MLFAGMDFVSPSPFPSNQHPGSAEERFIHTGETLLEGTLTRPGSARGIVVLPHASSAGRFRPQHRFAGEVLEQSGLATLQVDLFTPAEEATLVGAQQLEQHTQLLLTRLLGVVAWLGNQPDLAGLAIGLFATSVETLPVLLAAERDPRIVAVVSDGGYPNSAGDAVRNLRAPTLLIVGRAERARAAELAAEFFARQLRGVAR